MGTGKGNQEEEVYGEEDFGFTREGPSAANREFVVMGLCWSSSSDSPSTTPSSTGNISSGAYKSSNNKTTTGTSRGSNISSVFSAGSGDDAYPKGLILPVPNLRIFSLARNFKSENVLVEGGFGKV